MLELTFSPRLPIDVLDKRQFEPPGGQISVPFKRAAAPEPTAAPVLPLLGDDGEDNEKREAPAEPPRPPHKRDVEDEEQGEEDLESRQRGPELLGAAGSSVSGLLELWAAGAAAVVAVAFVL